MRQTSGLWRWEVVAGFDEGDETFLAGDRWLLVLSENRRIWEKQKLNQNRCQTEIELETKNEYMIWEEEMSTENENWKGT